MLKPYLSIIFMISFVQMSGQGIPLEEHPNPIKYRAEWENLNGQWDFAFDSLDVGLSERWFGNQAEFDREITVPFPWGAPLSGVEDEADIGWYSRNIRIKSSWEGKRIFLIIGAADWETRVWIDSTFVGSHTGGYVPIEMDLTEHIQYGESMHLVVRVDDKRRPHTLYGKQGYGNARGIWQTPYLEARGDVFIENVHVAPDIDKSEIEIAAYLDRPLEVDTSMSVTIMGGENPIHASIQFKAGQTKSRKKVTISDQRLWTLDDPYLYEVIANYGDDALRSYFGMRKIGVVNLAGTDIPYIALNNKPIYLQMALDQSYHPGGYYTFPSEQFIIDEIKRSKSIGLNGIRTHIKVEVPRKLYWADRLGLLVMEDLPNSWGAPEELMQEESTYTLREMIKRDYNHPSIFSWVIINETWGMFTETENGREYLPETQKWLESLYHLAKSLDTTRLIEDNSICCGRGHTVTDINSWHVYLPGYEWDKYLQNLSDSTYVGSGFNYEEGYVQGPEPNFNSECGNVWGYKGSAGDVDWSWDYHRMINSFRKYPKIAGWLYTEHHDVVNEWNGYWRFDRSEKYTGLEDIVPGMTLNDLHADIYLSTGQDICYTADADTEIKIPLYLSVMTEREIPGDLSLKYSATHIDALGNKTRNYHDGSMTVGYKPWLQTALDSISIPLPITDGLTKLELVLETPTGEIVHRNFVHVVTVNGKKADDVYSFSLIPSAYSDANWTDKLWDAMDGKKVNGAGTGFFEYTIPLSDEIMLQAKESYFLIELSAKELFVKDMVSYDANQDFMRGSKVMPSSNPNSYPMTDQVTYPSNIRVTANGEVVTHAILPDDPADHRGVLSWHSQRQDRTLTEAGSYGYYIKVAFNEEIKASMAKEGRLVIRFESINGGGLAIYGKEFGRYPFDPTLIILN